ncbi:MAG: hypothetical protein ACOYWZ_11090 [Bacillota bacterium]
MKKTRKSDFVRKIAKSSQEGVGSKLSKLYRTWKYQRHLRELRPDEEETIRFEMTPMGKWKRVK